jgi:hypothetical protein
MGSDSREYLVKSFLQPPKYYHLYESYDEAKTEFSLSISELKSDCLLPPKIPKSFKVFGYLYSSKTGNEREIFVYSNSTRLPWESISFKENNLRLPPPHEAVSYSAEIKKSTLSVLIEYLKLLKILSKSPDKFLGPVLVVQDLLDHIYATVNVIRPHQARETLIEILKLQRNQKFKIISEVVKFSPYNLPL